MATTNLYLKLNQYFPEDKDITDLIKYKKTGITNKSSYDTPEKQYAYKTKYKDFGLSADKKSLIYEPLHLTVVPKKNIKKILKTEYLNNFGAGVTNFYKSIRTKYLNIMRQDVSTFIKQQTIPQLTGQFTHRTNKPIVSQFPNQVWCMDLIDVSQYESKNKHYNYIFNLIDVFSRKLFMEPMKVKSAETTKKVLQTIIRKAGIKPDYLISDRGTEFQGIFADYCKQQDIKQRMNRAYSPQANGIIERANFEIRKLMRDIFIKNNNNNWVDSLRNIENLHNNTFTSATNNIPNKIWAVSKEPIVTRETLFHLTKEKTDQLMAKQVILKNIKKHIHEFKNEELEVGDKIRIRMDALSQNIRKMVKNGQTKDITVVYSPFVFTVLHKIIPRKTTLERSRYIVGYNNHAVITKTGGKSRQFYSNVLLKVDPKEKDYPISMEQAIKLSGEELNANDAKLDNQEYKNGT